MPSVDHNTMTSSLEVFSTLKSNEDSNESDEESIHLHIDEDDEVETRSEKIDENEEDILNKFDPDYRSSTPVENIPKDGKNNEDKQEIEEDQKGDNNEEKSVANRTNQEETATDEEIKEKEIQNTKETANLDSPQETESNIAIEEATSPKVTEEKNDDTNNENVENNEKPENNGSKSDNDADDLLDVSKIRDAEEDNADDNVSNEECDEDMNDKTDSDDINNEQTNNKNDEVDIEENNLEMSCNEDDKTPKESNDETDDKINKDNADKNNNDKENNSEDEEMKDKTTGTSENRNSSKRSLTDINDDNSSDNLIKRQRLEENLQIIVNKLNDKLSEDNNNNNNNNSSSSSSEECQRPIVQSIEFFKDFMKKKNYKVSVYDLEELCLQKSCEAIQYCSKLGDTRHQLQIEEQLVETLRKDLQQVMKQARDLEIVNKKLMADLKQYMTVLTTKKTETTTTKPTNSNTTAIPIITPVKPLQPLKITRSVGLQVRFTPSYETVNVVAKRRQPVLVTQQKVTVSNNNKNQKTNAIVNSPVTTQSPPSRQQGIGTRTRNSTGTTTISTPIIGNAVTTTTTTTTTTATTNSIIDLTDEDDKQNKRPSTTNCTTISTQNRSIVARNSLPLRLSNQIQPVKTVPSNLRLTSSSSSSSSSSSATTTTTATKQITPTTKHSMYLVQSISPTMLTSTLSGTKVLLNVQSQNGILNGSTVSVIQKSVPSIQLKPTHTLKATNINGTNLTNCNSGPIRRLPNQHPAPLPLPPAPSKFDKNLKPIPPKPHLSIRKTDTGIILQWKMPYELDMYEVIASYQLFAYQETNAAPDTGMWRRVGDVKALALPMACTLTQFADNNKYYFAVRPVDIHKRIGAFSDPEEISL